jgi:predicted nucleotidyltransferase
MMTNPGGAGLRAAVAALISAVPGLQAVYQFGSSVTGTEHPASDVDLAFLAAAPVDPLARFDVQQAVASAIHRDVDLVDLRAASSVMAMQVLSTGRLLHEADPVARGLFEDLTYGAYARLNEERRGILDRIAAEGTVHGR